MLHNWNPISAISVGWDIEEMIFENKKKWISEKVENVSLAKTATFMGAVYPVSEMNYILWGMLNRLLYDDGISTLWTNKTVMSNTVSAYRIAAGGVVGPFSTYWDPYETIEGKISFAEFGWEWVRNLNIPKPSGSITGGIANPTPWKFSLTASVKKGDELIVRTSGFDVSSD